ncbi:hypothetical protein [Actinomadura miaoliensis]|uniref:Polyadenylate-specific 3'-exoribonuclease AS n=1 Tax=Actinomadura miaoliensis TaxID=430685 RepID=A0ABP7W7N1_9ACTN
MKVFYDTEFIDVDGKTIDLVSIGMVAEDGRELYAVSSEFDQRKLLQNTWLREHVWPSLPTTPPRQYRDGLPPHGVLDTDHPDVWTRAQIARAVERFILDTPDVELWAYYAAYDHVALCQLWGPMMHLPEGIPMYTADLRQEMHRLGDPDFPAQTEGLHNALADARHNMVIDKALAALRGE